MEWNNLIKKLEATNKSLKAAAKQFDALIAHLKRNVKKLPKGKGAPKRKKRSK
jgi:hypothetical protein